MKFAALSTLVLSVFAAPAPESNYKLLTDAIDTFQSDSDYTWQLIMTGLAQEKALLNSFSTSSVGNLTLFLPADAGFLSLNLATLSQNDLYTYLQYHVAISAPSGTGYKRTYVGDDVNVNETHVNSALGHSATILGSATAGDNVLLYFIDEVLTPPVSIRDTATFYNWTQVASVLDAAKAAKITYTTSKDNTYLIPSEASIEELVAASCPPSEWSTDFLQLLLETLSFSSGRVYSELLDPAGGNFTTNSKLPATYTIDNGTVTFSVFGISAEVVEADIQVQLGVAHIVDLDTASLPSIKGYCQ